MKIAVLTSGGDAPGMNAAIRAVVRCGIDKGMEVYGIQRGYEGLLNGEFVKMDLRSVGDIIHRGGTIIKTARSPRFATPEGIEKASEMLRTFEIDGLVVIGGDGSLHGALELAKKGINVMGLPGTIDNDLGYTDATIGFDTAVSTVLEGIAKLRDTSAAHDRVTVVEVMGRHCGDIALYAGLTGGAEAVLIPEKEIDLNQIYRRVIEGENKGKQHTIIINAEGSGIATDELTRLIQEHTGRDTKAVNLSYLQRGGTPTMRDRLLAGMTGAKAVELIAEGARNKAIGIVGSNIEAFDLAEALEMKREFNHEMYDLIGVLAK